METEILLSTALIIILCLIFSLIAQCKKYRLYRYVLRTERDLLIIENNKLENKILVCDSMRNILFDENLNLKEQLAQRRPNAPLCGLVKIDITKCRCEKDAESNENCGCAFGQCKKGLVY